jgi:alkylhydroperoxidase family enzyme
LRQLTEDPILVHQLAANYRAAERLSAKERAMLDFAAKVTTATEACTEGDLEALRAAGWTDEEYHQREG